MGREFELNLVNIPKELQLILELIKCDNDHLPTIQTDKAALFTMIDWDLFIDLSMHHRIYPILSPKLKVIDSQVIPFYVIEFISNQYKRNTFQMLHLSGELEQVSHLFSNNQLPLLLLKGPALAHELYGDISLRTSSDLDILVPLEQLQQAEDLLIERGYKKDDYIETVLNDWKWRHHHVTFFHPQKNIKLEIHWRLNPGPAKEPSFEELWDRKCKGKLTSTTVYLLGKEDLFIFLVSHGARHGWSRLRWLVDINQLINQEIDWDVAKEILKKYHYNRAGGQALNLLSQLFGAELNIQLKSLTMRSSTRKLAQQAVFYLENMVSLHTDPVPDEVSRYHRRHLFSLMSLKQKFLFIISFLYPYPEDRETLPLPKHIHFLYFPLRPFLWAWRKTRKHALP